VATNGVIHVVEDVLLPDSAKTSLLDSVKSRSKFLAEMIEKSGKITPNFHFILVLYSITPICIKYLTVLQQYSKDSFAQPDHIRFYDENTANLCIKSVRPKKKKTLQEKNNCSVFKDL
jgi:hypothetical protein